MRPILLPSATAVYQDRPQVLSISAAKKRLEKATVYISRLPSEPFLSHQGRLQNCLDTPRVVNPAWPGVAGFPSHCMIFCFSIATLVQSIQFRISKNGRFETRVVNNGARLGRHIHLT